MKAHQQFTACKAKGNRSKIDEYKKKWSTHEKAKSFKIQIANNNSPEY